KLANPVDAFGKDPRAAIGLFIAVDAGQHRVLQPHRGHAFAHTPRLIRVKQPRLAGLDLAETAAARAGIAHQQEGSRPPSPTFADIGTHGLFTYGVQMLAAE